MPTVDMCSFGRGNTRGRHAFTSHGSAAALLSLGLLAAVPAHAQTVVEADNDLALEEVIVTARKREESMQTVPVTVNAVSGDALATAGISNMSQLQQLVPSVTFISYAGNPSVSMRGSVNRINGSPGVGFFTDGVFTANTSQFSHGPLDVARVEVLQGPQGTIFGRNTIAGAINFITNDPTSEFEGSVQAGYGGSSVSGDTIWHAQAIVSGPIAPNLEGRFAYRHNDRKGFLYDPTTGVRLGYSRGDYARGKLMWTPTDQTTVRLTGEYSTTSDPRFEGLLFHPGGVYLHQGTRPLALWFAGLSGGFYEIRQDPAHAPSARNRLARTYLEVTHETSLGTLTSETSYADTSRKTLADIDFIGARLAEQRSHVKDETFTQEFRIAGDMERLDWLAGVFFLDQDIHTAADTGNDYFSPGRLFERGNGGYRTPAEAGLRAYAAFAQVDLTVVPRLTVTLGGRWSRDERKQVSSEINFVVTNPLGPSPTITPAPALTINRKGAWEDFTYLVSARYNITDDIMVYGTRSTGFKSGAFNLLANPAVPALIDPETVLQHEIGLKSEMFDRRVRLNIAAYRLKYKDLQVQAARQIGAQFIAFTGNAGNSTVEGLDIELKAVLTENFTLTVSDTYLPVAKITAFAPTPVTPDITGFRMPRTSKNAYNVALDYRQDLAEDMTLRLGVSYSYRTGFTNELEATRKPDGTFANIPLPGYGLVGLTASLSRGPWEIEAYVRNLNNKKYFTSAANLGGGANWPAISWGEPRTYEVSLNYRF